MTEKVGQPGGRVRQHRMVDLESKAGSDFFPVLIIGDSGGVHVRNRALAMARMGYEIHTLTPRPSGLTELNEIVPAGRSDHGRLLALAPGNIVHVHYASSLGAWAFVASGDRRPLVVSVMGGDVLFDEQGNPSRAARWLVRQVLRRADFVTAKSEYLVQRLIELGVPEGRIEKIFWGVDTDLFQPGDVKRCKRELGLPEDSPVIFSPRILKPFYRTDVLVRALPDVLARFPETRLVISEYEADPAYKTEIQDLAREIGVADAVTFVGVIPYDRMPAYYNAADVAVGIPPSDGFPQTVFEAMACGTPNIVTGLSRYEEVLTDGESALFAEPTADGVAVAILSLLSDGGLAETLVANALKVVREKADLGREAVKVSDIYRRLWLSRPCKPRPLFARWVVKGLLGGLAVRDSLKTGTQSRVRWLGKPPESAVGTR